MMYSYPERSKKLSYFDGNNALLPLRQRNYDLEYDEDYHHASNKSNIHLYKKELSFNIKYTLFNIDYCIPLELNKLKEIIDKSKNILSLKDNWDGQKGEPISNSTFQAMTKFIITYACNIYHNYNRIIDMPHIYPSLCGSIDLDWDTSNYGLLINIGKDGNIATFYADDCKCSQKTEGCFNPNSFDFKLLPIAYNG